MSENSLKELILKLTHSSERLTEVLEAERAALVARDLPALAEVVAAKQAICQEIETLGEAFAATPLVEQIELAPESGRPELARLHSLLRACATRAQDYNAVNGKIVQRSQQSIRELMHLISGTDTDLLYGERGRTSATAKGSAIASA